MHTHENNYIQHIWYEIDTWQNHLFNLLQHKHICMLTPETFFGLLGYL